MSGNMALISITIEEKSIRYIPGCFPGHSPPWHVEITKKFLTAQAKLIAVTRRFIRLAQILVIKLNARNIPVKIRCK